MRIQEIVKRLAEGWSSEGRVEDVAAFDPIEEELGQHLPADYKWFLMWSNGGEALPPFPYYGFYSLEELLARRSDGQPPAVLEFCTDDSDGFAFDLLTNRDGSSYPVVSYSLGETDRSDIQLVADSFAAFMTNLIQVKAEGDRRR